MSQVKIVWEKWENPIFKNKFKEESPEIVEKNGEYFEKTEHDFMITPFGVMPTTEEMFASSKFDFWVMNINMPLNELIVQFVSEAPGVEMVNILTRYRIIIGFNNNNLFEIRESKFNIQESIKVIYDELFKFQLKKYLRRKYKKFIHFKKIIVDKNKYWAILVLPNGHVSVLKSENFSQQLYKKVVFFNRISKKINAILLTSPNLG